MPINISDKFDYKKLLRFTFPSIVMMLFTSLYVIADGYFVSNFCGKTALASVNFSYPVLMILGSIGFMFGTGGSAIISKKLGEKKDDEANNIFSFLVIFSLLLGIILTVFGLLFMEKIAYLMGARGELLNLTTLYGKIILTCLPAYILQYEFQCLFVTANKPKLGLYVTVAAGVSNIILDWFFICILHTGVAGGAIATAASQLVGGIIPFVYFLRKNTSLLRLHLHFKWDGKSLLKAVTNGSSEFMGNISASIVSAIYNLQLLKYSGEDGLAAYAVIMYVNIIFMSLFIGYSVGSAPIISYNYGAEDIKHLKSIVKKSYVIITLGSFSMIGLSLLMARPLVLIFVSYDKKLLDFTVHAFRLYSISFLFCGFSIFSSSLFTALNNGLVSALISFARTLFFQVVCILLIPYILGTDGIWLSTTVAEIAAFVFSLFFVFSNKKKYGY